MNYQLIIFDLDGTLMDSIGGIRKAVNMMLESHNYPTYSVEEYYQFVGNGLMNTVKGTLAKETLTQDEIDLLYREMLTYYEQYYDYGLKPFEGACDLLKELEGRIHIAINSNKNDDLVQKIVRQYLHEFHFEDVWGVKEGQALKPDPWAVNRLMKKLKLRASDILYVGDSEVDIMTAKNAGVDVCFVTWGFRKKTSVLTYNPEYIAENFEELGQVIKGEKVREK